MKYKIEPWAHQLEGIRLGRERDFFAYFFEMGCGKTLTVINVLRHKFAQHGKMLNTLILCPKIVVENWRREIAANASDVVLAATQCLKGTAKQREKQLAVPNKCIYITNIDTLNTKFWNVLRRMPWQVLVVDESHKFKSPTADRTKRLINFSDCVRTKFIMSGSPVLNSAMDVWAQFRVLHRDIFPENFYVFRQQYFYDHNAGMPTNKYFPDWRPRPGTREELRRIIGEHSMRITTEEALPNLPPLVRQSVFVELTAEQRRLYTEMEETFITYLQDEACVAEVALTKILRLQQIAVGIVKTESGEVRKVETAKLAALTELLEDLCPQHKVIVWTNFVDTYSDIGRVFDELNFPYVILRGGQSDAERQDAIDRFNNDPTVRGIVANQQAGGVGIGLQAASYSIYYSKTFNLEHDQQSEKRNHRGGSEIHDHITRIDIVAQDTMDDEITTALRNKAELGTFLLSLRRRYGIETRTGNGLGSGEEGGNEGASRTTETAH